MRDNFYRIPKITWIFEPFSLLRCLVLNGGVPNFAGSFSTPQGRRAEKKEKFTPCLVAVCMRADCVSSALIKPKILVERLGFHFFFLTICKSSAPTL